MEAWRQEPEQPAHRVMDARVGHNLVVVDDQNGRVVVGSQRGDHVMHRFDRVGVGGVRIDFDGPVAQVARIAAQCTRDRGPEGIWIVVILVE